MDEYYRTSESIAFVALKRFCKAVHTEFEPHHMKQRTRHDFKKQLAINKACGFPGMFASLDCIHWT